ncbi:hypothetical protein M1105_17195 [Limibaculum sp. FT325]|uniref:hypothetical protein n=1 Tax=Thermohalobaculum sediminis TaxID=2939436 RepID=UPI0020BE7694|nr:hypothetical protein [Limibaculum sediminis]MCL5778714.1 hypothetical protein [Limibaculum sediminis]
MFMKPAESIEAWTKPTKAAFDFWVSFWPVAPAFGVEWRFAEVMPRFTPRILETGMEPEEAPAEAAAPKKAKAVRKAPKPHAEPAVDIVEAVEAAIAPVDALVEAAIENVTGIVDAMSEAAAAQGVNAVDALPSEEAAPAAKPAGLLDAAPAKADDLKLIKGIGPALEAQLNGLGVYTFAQIAGFSDADLAWVDENLTAFKGRCFRDDWIGQARAHLG